MRLQDKLTRSSLSLGVHPWQITTVGEGKSNPVIDPKMVDYSMHHINKTVELKVSRMKAPSY